MQYLKHYPSNLLKDYVECYFIWRCPAPDQPLWVDTPPNAFTAFVFNLENSYSVKLEEHKIVPLPRSFISGQSIRNYSLKVDSQIDQIGIVFKPTGIYHLFDIPLYEFTNTRLDIHAVLNRDVKYLEEKLYHAENDEKRIQLLESVLLDKLKSKNPELDGVDYASQKILHSYGTVNVTDLLTDSYMSRRTFERHFFKRVGLSPKYYARIRRYGYLCSLIAGKRSVDWDEVLYKVGYYDQSHFIKDFKEFSGLPPNQYLLTNKELAHSVQVTHS